MNFNSLIPKNYVQREIEEKIFKFLQDREIIVIRGARQTGKSTLLKKIASFLEKKYSLEQIIFIDLEDEIEQIKFEKNPLEYIEFYLRKNNKIFLLLDEIQYIKKAGKILKLLFDKYHQIKFIISGSSTLDINKLGEYLVGRAIFFELYPFSFGEFLKAKNEKLFLEYSNKKINIFKPQVKISLFLDKLNNYLKEYLTFGGYPRIVLEKNKEKKKILLKNLFSTYIEKDVIKLFGLKYKEKAVILLKYLSSIISNLINYNDLCQITNSHFQEIKELISIFENTYILKKIHPFHKNLVTELKKNPKIYFYDLGFRNILLERFEFSEEEWGKILENYAFLILKDHPLSYWRTTAKAEVDFILKEKQIPFEIKIIPKITRSFLSFLINYQPPISFIGNWEMSKKIRENNTNVFFVPLALF